MSNRSEAIKAWLGVAIPSDKRLAQLTEALHQIASASPCVSHPGAANERTCVLCETFINVARDAMGRERWPAESTSLHGDKK